MINIKENLEFRETAVMGSDLANQVFALYQADPERGKELAIAAIAYVMSGGIEVSTDPVINIILQGSKTFVQKNAAKWEERKASKENSEIEKKRLLEIAMLLRQGWKQNAIARELSIATSTVSDRVRLIRTKYSYLLEDSCPNSDNCESGFSDENNCEDQCDDNSAITKSGTHPEIRKKFGSERISRNPAGFSDEINCSDMVVSSLDSCSCPSRPENPEIRRIRDNVNVNVNVNVNENVNGNSFLSPENPSDSSGENSCKKIRISSEKKYDDKNPDETLNCNDKKIRTNPDENPAREKSELIQNFTIAKNPDSIRTKIGPDKKSGQMSELQVLGNPDNSDENITVNPDDNWPQSTAQKEWLRQRGYL